MSGRRTAANGSLVRFITNEGIATSVVGRDEAYAEARSKIEAILDTSGLYGVGQYPTDIAFGRQLQDPDGDDYFVEGLYGHLFVNHDGHELPDDLVNELLDVLEATMARAAVEWEHGYRDISFWGISLHVEREAARAERARQAQVAHVASTLHWHTGHYGEPADTAVVTWDAEGNLVILQFLTRGVRSVFSADHDKIVEAANGGIFLKCTPAEIGAVRRGDSWHIALTPGEGQ